MTEDKAREEVEGIVGLAATSRLDALVTLVVQENTRQNLIGRSTLDVIWQRHVLDSIQLLRLARSHWQHWLDVGTGGGFPGLAIACATELPMTLVEPRALRAAFLQRAASELQLKHVKVTQEKVEQLTAKVDVISARAVAPPLRLLSQARKCAKSQTQWLFPVGRWSSEDTTALAKAQPTIMFHVKQSRSDPDAKVLVAYGCLP